MGIATLLDIVGSTIIGGILLLTLFRMNSTATQNTYNFSGELIVQENMVVTVEVLEYDLRKIGYCENPFNIPNPARAILYGDSSRIKYLTDIDFDGNVDTLEYYLGPVSELSGTPNPNDKMLYRLINGAPSAVNLGVTDFNIKYYGALGNELPPPLSTVPTGITSLQVDVSVENTAAYNEEYRFAFWKQIRMSSRNLNNR
ncbi:MAG: hypothetical protein WBH40_11585 [Ignavibacteriaceae bacterium]